jgi:hypothetical protein
MTVFRNARGMLAVLVGLALIVGGVAVASNMGFKFVPDIAAGDNFNLSLPWNNNYTNAEDLRQDTGASQVSKVTTDLKLTSWFPGAGSAALFDVVPKEAYVLLAPSDAGITPVVVGSHDPNATIDFTADEWQNLSAPYHQTLGKASDLFNDIDDQLGTGTVAEVAKITADLKLTSWFPGAGPSANFDLNLGMGVAVKAASTQGGYQWPHY